MLDFFGRRFLSAKQTHIFQDPTKFEVFFKTLADDYRFDLMQTIKEMDVVSNPEDKWKGEMADAIKKSERAAKVLKGDGNDAFKARDYIKACDMYSQVCTYFIIFHLLTIFCCALLVVIVVVVIVIVIDVVVYYYCCCY